MDTKGNTYRVAGLCFAVEGERLCKIIDSIDGFAPFATAGGDVIFSFAEGGEALTLKWDAAQEISQVRLTFDPNLNHCIKLTMSSHRMAEQGTGVAPELVQDYDVLLKKGGAVVAEKQVRGNYQRHNILDFDKTACDEIEVRVHATHGYADVRVYEVRAY